MLSQQIEKIIAERNALRDALRPFARFWDAQRHMGPTSPKTGTLYRVESHVGGLRELTAEDFKAAHALIPPTSDT